MNDHDPVVIAPYDPSWPKTFGMLRERLAPLLDELVVGIEHIGSTAVPGLAAKPIVDIDVVIRYADDFEEVALRLAELGYEHVGDRGVVGREVFRAPVDLPRHHLYVCASGSAPLQAHLILRDALREHPALAARYAVLKRELAERYPNDRDSYTEGKSTFITSVLIRQRRGEQRSNRG